MIIIGPVAMTPSGVIGSFNDLPWYIPEDLKHFRKITEGHTVLMGRKTYDSILFRLGKVLPNRKNVVITRSTSEFTAPEGVLVFDDINKAFNALKKEDVYVIGGSQIWELAFPKGEYMYVTHVKKEYPGNIYFPKVNWDEWEKVSEEPHEEFTFSEYKRK